MRERGVQHYDGISFDNKATCSMCRSYSHLGLTTITAIQNMALGRYWGSAIHIMPLHYLVMLACVLASRSWILPNAIFWMGMDQGQTEELGNKAISWRRPLLSSYARTDWENSPLTLHGTISSEEAFFPVWKSSCQPRAVTIASSLVGPLIVARRRVQRTLIACKGEGPRKHQHARQSR